MNLILIVLLFGRAPLYAAAPREELKTLTAQLQAAPSDDALREKIIKLATGLKPAPTIPKEARRPFVMAATYQKEAKAPGEFDRAIKAYQEALTLAPWWGDAYYNLSVVLESAKRYDEAKKALKAYLLTNPKDAQQAEDRLYTLEAKANVVADENSKTRVVPGVGIGGVKLGMTEAQVTAAWGEPDDRVMTTDSSGASHPRLAWGKPQNRVVLFDGTGCAFISVSDPEYRTAEGIGSGSSVAEARSALGPAACQDLNEFIGTRQWYAGGLLIQFGDATRNKSSGQLTVMSPANIRKACSP